MNDTPEPAARPEAGGAKVRQVGRRPEFESQPVNAAAAAAAEAPADRPSFFERLAGLFRQRNGSSLREEIADALAETATDAESFSPGERAMLHNILRLARGARRGRHGPARRHRGGRDRHQLGELMTVFEQSGHSRMPVYSETLDDPRGMVHIRDVLAHITKLARAKKGRGARKAASAVRSTSPMSICPRRSASST